MKQKLAIRIFVFLLLSGCAGQKPNDKMIVFVSIPPQKFFVEKIAGPFVDVHVMVGKGQNPATYEVLPSQLLALQKAKIYFRVGLPFEMAWLPKIARTYPELKIIDTRRGIRLRRMQNAVNIFNKSSQTRAVSEKSMDPHIWTAPLLVKIQARTIAEALIESDPVHKGKYLTNLFVFEKGLDDLDHEIRREIRVSKISNFMVFHPSWGYFADSYDLRQIPIEIEGKEPSAANLKRIIDYARLHGIHVIFAQPEFSTRSAKRVAHAIHGEVLLIDPLEEDYFSNMRHVVRTLTGVTNVD